MSSCRSFVELTLSLYSSLTRAAVATPGFLARTRDSVTFHITWWGLKETMSSRRRTSFICPEVGPRAPRNTMASVEVAAKGAMTMLRVVVLPKSEKK